MVRTFFLFKFSISGMNVIYFKLCFKSKVKTVYENITTKFKNYILLLIWRTVHEDG